jgi:Na+/H+ antiporter NhaA
MPRRLLQVISWAALGGIIIPPLLFLLGNIELETTKNWMLAATIAWFAATPLWMGRKSTAV